MSTDSDQHFYDQVAKELLENNINKGLWTKAYAKGGGIENAVKSKYIELRVNQLKEIELSQIINNREKDREIKEDIERREALHKQEANRTSAIQIVQAHRTKKYPFDHFMFWLGWIGIIGIPYAIVKKIGAKNIGKVIVILLFGAIVGTFVGNVAVRLEDGSTWALLWTIGFATIWFQIAQRMNKWQIENSQEYIAAVALVGKNPKSILISENAIRNEQTDWPGKTDSEVENKTTQPHTKKEPKSSSSNIWVHIVVWSIALFAFIALLLESDHKEEVLADNYKIYSLQTSDPSSTRHRLTVLTGANEVHDEWRTPYFKKMSRNTTYSDLKVDDRNSILLVSGAKSDGLVLDTLGKGNEIWISETISFDLQDVFIIKIDGDPSTCPTTLIIVAVTYRAMYDFSPIFGNCINSVNYAYNGLMLDIKTSSIEGIDTMYQYNSTEFTERGRRLKKRKESEFKAREAIEAARKSRDP